MPEYAELKTEPLFLTAMKGMKVLNSMA